MASPHDQLFWQVFSDPHHAAGELRALLPPHVERLIAWHTLEPLPATFKDPDLGDQHADLLFAVEIGIRPALLYLLLEHKSTEDRWTAFQLARYVVRILERFRRECPDSPRFPPVVAMVVYHGPSGWNRSTELLERFDLDDLTQPALEPLMMNLRFLLDDLSEATPESLANSPRSALAQLTSLCLQQIREERDLGQTLRGLREVFRDASTAADTGAALSTVLSYIARVRDLPRDELRALIRNVLGPELEDAMTSTYDQLLNEGRALGKAEGKAEGKTEGQSQILLKQLTRRFGELPSAIVERVQTADITQLEEWALRVLDAQTLELVFAAE